MKRRKLVSLVCAALVFLAALGVWERPISGVYFHCVIPVRLALAGGESRWVSVNGARVHYDVLGPAAGAPVILVHGLGGRAEEWLALAHDLAKAGHRVYLPDLVGYGRSDQPAGFSYSVRDEAGVVVGFMDAMGLKQVDLGGISMGGWIVQIVASEHPERVRRLMLFDSAGIHEQPAWDTQALHALDAERSGAVERSALSAPGAGAGICGAGYSAHHAPEWLGDSPRAGVDAQWPRCLGELAA